METDSQEFLDAVAKAVAAEVAGLKSTNSKLKDEKTEVTGKLSGLQTQLDEYAAADATRANKAATKKGDWDKLEASLKDKQAAELEVREGRITALTASLRSEMLEKRAVEAIAAAGGSAKVLKPHVLNALSIHEDDGQFHAVVVDSKGAPRLTADAKTATDYMTVAEYVDTLKDDPDFSGVFSGTGAGGGGATSSKSQGSRSGPKRISSTDPLAFGRNAEAISRGDVEIV
jgi:hypothetical protein